MKANLFIAVFVTTSVFCSAQPKAGDAEPTTAARLCEEYWKLLTSKPLVPGAIPSQRDNYSSNRDFATKSAALVQRTIGGRIDTSSFSHLPFTITLPDRKIDGNFFAFGFATHERLKKYLAALPQEAIGKRGVLTAKAPQQFEAGAKDNCLLVLVVDGVRIDDAVGKLFEQFELMTKVKVSQETKESKTPSDPKR